MNLKYLSHMTSSLPPFTQSCSFSKYLLATSYAPSFMLNAGGEKKGMVIKAVTVLATTELCGVVKTDIKQMSPNSGSKISDDTSVIQEV